MIIARCAPRARCRLWKKCPQCANIRQAQIANIAELGASTSRSITYAVVRPLTNDIATQKAQVIKKLGSRIDGGIWTIETGKETAGLHTNLILGSDTPIHAQDIAEALTVEASVYAEHVPHTDVRKIAAYSSKQSAYPHKDEYKGRLYGSFGTFKRPLAIVAESKMSPIIGAMALEQMLDDAGIPEPSIKPDILKSPLAGCETKEQMKERGKANEKARNNAHRLNTQKLYDENLRRLIAVHSGEIELNGFAYVAGFGFIGKDEARRLGVVIGDDN